MKRFLFTLLFSVSIPVLFCGCEKRTPAETITDRNIPVGDVTDFYYTYENINYNAFYQRYRFYYADNGMYVFYHETREKPNDYGWTTEKDVTASGTIVLTDKQWAEVMGLLKNGTVTERVVSDEDGDSGPWMYIYWKNDESRYQQFDFPDYAEQKAFEDYCAVLAGG